MFGPAFGPGGPLVEQFARYTRLLVAGVRRAVDQGLSFGNVAVELANRARVIG